MAPLLLPLWRLLRLLRQQEAAAAAAPGCSFRAPLLPPEMSADLITAPYLHTPEIARPAVAAVQWHWPYRTGWRPYPVGAL